MPTWKRDVASGLIVLIPILVTLYVVTWLYAIIANIPFLQEIIKPSLFGDRVLIAELVRVALTLLIFAGLVLSTGYLMRTALGSILEEALDDFINHVPGLRVIYNASKMAVKTTLSGTEELQRPVKLELWNGARLTAFKTGKRTDDGREVVFMPTAPNITTGFVMEVEPERLNESDEKVEDALTRILSAGFGESRDQGIPIDVIDAVADDQDKDDDSGEGG
ncbi:MAG: DUF502 domain-containing protein [Halobacteriales archaeon]|nr:DUF502 domain-containing protein [Halobacteriales archaeon]